MSIRYETVRILRKFFSNITHQHGNVTNDGKIGNSNGKIVTTGNNGVLQASDSITKDKISDFPSTIPPSAHQHRKSEISDFSHTHTKEEITNFPNSMTPASHSHGALTNNGTLNNDTSNVSKVVVTDNENNLKTISQLPFGKLNVNKANIVGLGIPSQDTTYSAGTGLTLQNTVFSVDDIPDYEVIHTIDSDSDFSAINGGSSLPVGTIVPQKQINELINARLTEIFNSLDLSTVTITGSSMQPGRYTNDSWIRWTKIGRLVVMDYHLQGNSSLARATTLHVCTIPDGYYPIRSDIYSNWTNTTSNGQIRTNSNQIKLYITGSNTSNTIAGQLIYFTGE